MMSSHLVIIGSVLLTIYLLIKSSNYYFNNRLNFEDCPREMRGYNCHGKGCDHSKEEVEFTETLNDIDNSSPWNYRR